MMTFVKRSVFWWSAITLSMALASVSPALAAAPERPETTRASFINDTSAVFNGILNTSVAASAGWFFNYNAGRVCTGGKSTPLQPEEEVIAEHVSISVSDLLPNTEYTFCLVARNAAEEVVVGNAVSFTTGQVHLTPWWAVSTGAQPTTLSGSAGEDEVQQLTIDATEGEFLIAKSPEQAINEVLEFIEGKRTKEQLHVSLLPFNATKGQVQAAFDRAYSEQSFTERLLSVSGGGGEPFVITFPGQGQVVKEASIETGFLVSLLGGVPLAGGKAEAEVQQLKPGAADEKVIIVNAQNRGDAPSSGAVSVVDHLPAGLEAVSIEARAGARRTPELAGVACVLDTLTCTFAEHCSGTELSEGRCSLPPYEEIEVRIAVVPRAGVKAGEVNTATVSGGGAARVVSASHALATGTPERFGVEDFSVVPENVGGTIDTQAGSHPFQLTSVVTLNTQTPDGFGNPRVVALPKDVIAELPAGQIGNPTPFAKCTDEQFVKSLVPAGGTAGTSINECSAESAVGVASVTFNEPNSLHYQTVTAPIFNMVTRPGEPVRFGFKAAGVVSVFLDGSVRSGGDYGVTITSSGITQLAWTLSVKLTFWGVPGSPAHDSQRGWNCLQQITECPATTRVAPPPFLVLPTSCEGAYEATVRADSWATGTKPSVQAEPLTYVLPETIDGCNQLPFEPSIKVSPDGSAASTPTGLNVDVHVPQDAVLNAGSLAESAVRGITVALPEGVAVNPAGGDGLQACSEGQVGFTGIEPGRGTNLFTSSLPEPFCPDASKIGEVTIHTPILPNPIKGFVYIATQNENPFGSLVALYVIAQDPVSGVLVKLAGETHLSAAGQITATFKNSPQAPFEDAELHFFGGARAPLATPAHCGTYTTNATFTPWAGNEAVNAASHFDITSGANATPCPSTPLPFAPSLTGGSISSQAGAFSDLTTTITREDGNQDIGAITLHMPPGLLGSLADVKLCGEADANAGTCDPESLIGETTVSAGLGPNPVAVKGGRVYITEKYGGAPFGLSIVNPVKTGPFDLEHDTSNPSQQPACDCIVVRAKVELDPHTAALSVTTDPSGPHTIPHLIDGIPVQIKHVNVTINREHFTFNPTNCSPLQITGAITGTESTTRPVSIPLRVTDCASLKFKPVFKVSTNGHTSKAGGASLSVKLAYPKAPSGSEANIAKVKVDLPKQLPSRLTTLQKSCLAATFEKNPASCPPASIVGHAKVITPLLPVPLRGPAYFVSHGGEAFPSLTMVLQGYGVTFELVGSTFIHNGVTSTTFKQAPDVPFNTFELTLPQGKYSALAANGNLCKTKLMMPTLFIAQNGLQINRNTPITTTNCHTKHRKHQKQRAKHKRHK